MGGKQSTPRVRTYSGSGPGTSNGAGPHVALGNSHNNSGGRLRARSLVTYPSNNSGGFHIPVNGGAVGGNTGSDSSSPDENSPVGHLPMPMGLRTLTHSLPVHLFALHGIKCPVCNKFVPPDDIECHLVVCLTKPRITYNEDVLGEDKGECVICLEELEQGDTIARLPCLCIYHKGCIDKWFEKNRSCPEHPQD